MIHHWSDICLIIAIVCQLLSIWIICMNRGGRVSETQWYSEKILEFAEDLYYCFDTSMANPLRKPWTDLTRNQRAFWIARSEEMFRLGYSKNRRKL